MKPHTVVIDNGTGFTKLGYAGNKEPNFVIPTCVAEYVDKGNTSLSREIYNELDFYIGEEAQKMVRTHNLVYPMASGEVQNWDIMEKLWHRCIYDYLRCETREHVVMLTEPPMNPPVNRESMAEIMFETFGFEGLHIGVQATLALYSAWYNSVSEVQKNMGLTGTVVDSGDGVTHIIPMVDGYVIGSCIKHVPLAGRDITEYIMRAIRDRGETLDSEDIKNVAKEIKDKFSYIADDPIKEIELFDQRVADKGKMIRLKTTSISTGKKIEVEVGHEIFMGPEMFFRPEIIDSKWSTSLVQMLDNTIQMSPVDCRRSLYKNIILSGGSTSVRNLHSRLEKELKETVATRMEKYAQGKGTKPAPIEINIYSSPYQNYAVWNGGSMLACHDNFANNYHKREDYFEIGPSIARFNPVFTVGAGENKVSKKK